MDIIYYLCFLGGLGLLFFLYDFAKSNILKYIIITLATLNLILTLYTTATITTGYKTELINSSVVVSTPVTINLPIAQNTVLQLSAIAFFIISFFGRKEDLGIGEKNHE